MDFSAYKEAKTDLVSRLGLYCSFCERWIATGLEVEHLQPKGLAKYSHLIGTWTNFLLACRNCNGTKGDKDVVVEANLLPDRDNTYAAFRYSADGKITTAPGLTEQQEQMAAASLGLTGLDKPIQSFTDANGKMVALDRVAQRMESWGIAERARNLVESNPGVTAVKDMAIELAAKSGHFSVWMTVFASDVEMKNRLIDTFPGTRASGCFDAATCDVVCPAPNPDGLVGGGKL